MTQPLTELSANELRATALRSAAGELETIARGHETLALDQLRSALAAAVTLESAHDAIAAKTADEHVARGLYIAVTLLRERADRLSTRAPRRRRAQTTAPEPINTLQLGASVPDEDQPTSERQFDSAGPEHGFAVEP